MAYDDYLNKSGMAAGGVMDAPDRQTWIAQQKVARGALHLLNNKDWNRLANRKFLEDQSFKMAMSQGARDAALGFATPNAATYRNVMAQRQAQAPAQQAPAQPVQMPVQQAPKTAELPVFRGRYGGESMYVGVGEPDGAPGYGSISGMAPYGGSVNIEVGAIPQQATQAPAPVVPPEVTPTSPAQALAQQPQASGPMTGSDVLDSVLKGTYAPKRSGMFDLPKMTTQAPSIASMQAADQAEFKGKLMNILGVSKAGPAAAPAPVSRPMVQPSVAANELLSYDAQLAQTPVAQPAPVQQAAQPVAQPAAQPAAGPVIQQTQAAQSAPQSPLQSASQLPQPAQYTPFTPKPFSVADMYSSESVSETMGNKAALDRYKMESDIAREAYTANVNAQSKVLRDTIYTKLKGMEIGEKMSKAKADEAAQQFAQTGGQMAVIDIDGKPHLVYQPSFGKFAVKALKEEPKQPSNKFVQGKDEAGQPLPFYTDTGTGKTYTIPPDVMMMQSLGLSGGAPAAAPAQAPAKGGQKISKEQAAAILAEAGGDKAKARKMATERGFSF